MAHLAVDGALAEHKLVLLTGEAGTGKTTLLGELARHWKDEGRAAAVCYCSATRSASATLRDALALDVQAHRATLLGEALELTGREWNVLEQLALAVPRVVAKQKLADSLSQWDKEITPNAVEVYISRLRGKLEPHGVALRSIRGFGYRLELHGMVEG